MLLVCTPLLALDPRRPLITHAVEVWQDGLPQQMVQSVLQSSDGALWLGTFEGLVRFNGIDFTVHDRRNHPEISEWRVRALAEAEPGTLWAGTNSGGALRYRNGAFRRFTTSDGLPSNTVTAIRKARDGTLWFGTATGLARLTGERLETVTDVHLAIESIAEESNGALVIAAADGAWRFAGGRLERLVVVPKGETEPYFSSAAVMRNGAIVLGTHGRGVFRIEEGHVTHFPTLGRAPSPWVNSILEDRDGSVWVGLAPGGLARISGESIEVLDQSSGLPSNSVRALVEDAEGSLWIGTNGGLARIKDLKFFNYTMRSGLTEDYIRVVLESSEGGLWLGTYGGGVNYLAGGKVTRYDTPEGLGDPFVRTIAQERDGTLWVGTGSGLNRIRRGGRVETIGAGHGFHGTKVDTILVRRDGALVVASNGVPLQLGVAGSFAPLPVDRPDDVKNARVLFEDRRGDLWIGTDTRGLMQVQGTKTIGTFNRRNGLPSDAVFALMEASNGDLWIGTHEGLALLRAGRVISLLGPGGLPPETIFQILADDLGYFWLTTNRGVIRVARAQLEDFAAKRSAKIQYEMLGKRDGMANDQCNGATQPAGIRLHDGRLAIPTVAGLSIVDPASLRRNQMAPPVNLTSVNIDGVSRNPAQLEQLGSADRFEFHYESLSLLQPEFVTFRYRIDGYDEEWIDAGSRRMAFYNSLPSGAHTFRVQARNNDGVWSRGEARYRFEIATPIWRRWWAIATYLACLALLFSGVLRLRVRSLRKANEQLEQRVHERTAQLQEANDQLTRTSHQLEGANLQLANLSATDGLTGIANRRRFDEQIEAEIRRAIRSGEPLSLIMIDVDHFKSFNDHYGHQAGDECLRQVADVLRTSFTRTSDVVARYGGEEFVVLLPMTSLQDAARQAEIARKGVEAAALRHAASSTAPVVTISLGVSSSRGETDAADLIARSDAALYGAKRLGRNRVEIAALDGSHEIAAGG
jgi:diguanylate cyclase (GGDEF)-like protein